MRSWRANAVLHPHAVIYPGCVIGNDFTAHSHVSVREYCRIGNRVTLHNGVVIGGDGFGFAKDNDGHQHKIVQSGITVLEDDVEVQTLTSIDRATLGETRVKRGAKIDSLCQIGHACVVGEDNIICGQTGLAGSTVLEENVIMAGQTGSSGHLTVHKNAIVWAQAGLDTMCRKARLSVARRPLIHAIGCVRPQPSPRLPGTAADVRALERRVAELEGKAPRNNSMHAYRGRDYRRFRRNLRHPRACRLCRRSAVETHLILSRWARTTIATETGYAIDRVEALASRVYHHDNQAAAMSSGSFKTDGMIIAPCSMKTLAAIRIGYADSLICRAADVILKERRKLVLLARESPFSEIHLENMLALTRMGAMIFSSVPAFYNHPETLDDAIRHIVGRLLDQFGLDAPKISRWEGF